MKNTTKYIVIAVVAILLIAGVSLLVFGVPNIEDWDENDLQIDGKWEKDVILRYADGSTESLADKSSPLTLYHNGNPVTSVELLITARATTPSGADPWDNVEIDLTATTCTASFYNSTTTTVVWSEVEDTYTSVVGAVDGNWFDVLGMFVDLEAVSDDTWEGGDTFKFDLGGSIQFRGTSTAGDVGNWNPVNIPDIVSFSLTFVGRDLILEWGDNVDWGGGEDWESLPTTGDMNGDGDLNSADALYLTHWLNGDAGYETLYANPDVDCSGTAADEDVTYLQCYLTGNPSCDPLYDGCYGGGGGNPTGFVVEVLDANIPGGGSGYTDVVLWNADNVGSIEFDLTFMNGVLDYDTFADGYDFSSVFCSHVPGSSTDTIEILAYDSASVDGDATVVRVYFDALVSSGTTSVNINNVEVYDATAQGNPITPDDVLGGTITFT